VLVKVGLPRARQAKAEKEEQFKKEATDNWGGKSTHGKGLSLSTFTDDPPNLLLPRGANVNGERNGRGVSGKKKEGQIKRRGHVVHTYAKKGGKTNRNMHNNTIR